MKKITTTLLTVLTSVTISFGQITTTKEAPKNDQTDNSPYDGSKNFLGKDVDKYLGQELFVKGKAETLRTYGYEGFKKTKSGGGIYKRCKDNYNSEYDELNGKYFKVLEIIKTNKTFNPFYLKLEEKISKDIVYFEYDDNYEFKFPFIVVGFFEKQKSMSIGKEFVFSSAAAWFLDTETKKVIFTKTGDVWKCIDLTINERDYELSVILQNSIGQKVTVSTEIVFGKLNKGTFLKLEAENYKNKFGDEIFDKILKGNLTIGMTKEMCKLAWGEPQKTNRTIMAGKTTEQWVYTRNYLYFDNGILTAIQ